ncbi:MAG: 50S ribosomal protein L14 [Candidatus Nezhaarchaeota archaeon]|nr:50S ribosomal protein L14 [Candidatus Nezhaarchaeota archaeon]MCX8141766.1 50S ribosomal protein L14 [Candidatus Nezhaarchaeota archaeon]MDW8050456.1 50S ribosomal protein L14 [Nitrososphaerota archaeon]
MAKRGAKAAVGISYRPRISPAIFPGSKIKCADNSGAQEVMMIGMIRGKSRRRRLVGAGVGDVIIVSVKKGTPEMRRQIMRAVVIRQKKPFRRPNGQWVQFEDNAVVIVTEEGAPKGTEIRGPVSREAAERWPKVAALATLII